MLTRVNLILSADVIVGGRRKQRTRCCQLDEHCYRQKMHDNLLEEEQ